MSVPSIINKTRHTFSGATRTFSFSFRIVSNADLEVTVNTTPLTLGTHYTVDGVNFYTGGTITIANTYALTSGDEILIRRKIASFTQDTIFRNQGAFYADTVEDALDKLTMMSQELNSKISLLPTYPDTDLNVDFAFPSPTVNGIFRWATRQVGTPSSTQYYITASTLSAADITTGTLPLARGGTGATSQQAAINSLVGTNSAGQYLRSNGANVAMSALLASDLSGAVPISAGGTGETTAAAAWTALGVPAAATSTPAALAVSGAVGTSTQWARADHVHARPTLVELGAAASGANTDISSIALTTGTISAAPAGGTNIANKAYVDGLASTIAPSNLMMSSSIGVSTQWARADHVHARPTRTELLAAGLGANTDITSIQLTSGTISSAPTNGNDIANKAYVDGVASGINFHNAVNFATTADLGSVAYNNGSAGVGATITKTSPFATLSIDGQSPAVGQRVLVKNQTNGAQNGIYIVTSVGSGSAGWVLTRAADYDVAGTGPNEINQGDFILVLSGTINGSTSWILQSAGPFTIGTTSLAFSQFSAGSNPYTAGTGLSLTGYQFNVSLIPIANGGTGATSQQGAINALAGAVTSGRYLRGNGTNVTMSELQTSDLVGTLPLEKGGTNATTAAQAWSNIGANYAATAPPQEVGNGTAGTSQAGNSSFWARENHVHRIAQIPNRSTGQPYQGSDIWNDVVTPNTGPGTFQRNRFLVSGIAGYPIEYNLQTMVNTGALSLSTPGNLQTLQFQTDALHPSGGVWRFVDFPTGGGGGGGGATVLAGDVTGNSSSNLISKIQGRTLTIPLTPKDNSSFVYDWESDSFKLSTKISDWLGYSDTNPSINIGNGALFSETPTTASINDYEASFNYSNGQKLIIKTGSGYIYNLNGSIANFTCSAGGFTATINGSNTIAFDGDVNIIGSNVTHTGTSGVFGKIVSFTSNSITFDTPFANASTSRAISIYQNPCTVVSAQIKYTANGSNFLTDPVTVYKVKTTSSSVPSQSIRSVQTHEYIIEEFDLQSIGAPLDAVLNVDVITGVNTAVGQNAGSSITTGTGNVFLGSNANVTLNFGAANNNVCIGEAPAAAGNDNVVLGRNAAARTTTEPASTDPTNNAVCIGISARASGSQAIAIGQSSQATTDAVAIGRLTYAANEGIAVGLFASAPAAGSVAIGKNSYGNYGIAIGENSGSAQRAGNSICIGKNAQGAFGRISIGENADSGITIDYTQSPRQQLFATGSSGSSVLTVVGGGASFPYLFMGISGTGIPTNTIIVGFDSFAGTITLSAPLTAAVTNTTALTVTHAFDIATDGTFYGNTCVKNCTATTGSTTLNITNLAVQNNTGVKVGATVTGTGIAANTKVSSLSLDGSLIELTAATTAAITNGAITFNSALPLLGNTTANSPVVRYSGLFTPVIGSALAAAIGGIPAGAKVIRSWQEPSAVVNNVLTPSTYVQFSRNATSVASNASALLQRVDYKQYLSASVSTAQAYSANLTVPSSANIRVGDIIAVKTNGRPIQITGTILQRNGGSGTVGQATITFANGSVHGLIAGLTVSGTGVPAGTTIGFVDETNKQILLTANLTASATGSYTFTTTNLQACVGFNGIPWDGAEVLSTSAATEITLSKNVTIPLSNVDIEIQPKQPSGISLGNNAVSTANELAIGDVRLQNALPATPAIISAIPLIVNGREGLIPVYAR